MVTRVLDENQQKRTDTDASKLGVYFEAWQYCWSLASVLSPQRKEVGDAATYAALYHAQFGLTAKQLGLTPELLAEAFLGYNPEREDAAFEAAIKSKNLKDSKPRPSRRNSTPDT
jgi:hypothetical protein